jgi:tripeptidyl-peptidase I
VAEGSTSGGITSGGGFSTYYPQHTWQSAAVSGYFPTAATLGKSPKPGYAANGRAYPDISLAGMNYLVIIGGNKYDVSGTSASCPSVAGFISNINAARLAEGKGSVGWINPSLYTKGSYFVNDIISGNTLCVADGTCCSTGFYATPGWDPATGLGSVNYGKMASMFVALGRVSASSTSTSSPVVTGTCCDRTNSSTDECNACLYSMCLSE